MPTYFFIDQRGNVRSSPKPAPVVTNEIQGAANGVDLTIRGAVGQPGTNTYAPHVRIIGGASGPGSYNYAGSVYIDGGPASVGTYSYAGDIRLRGGDPTGSGTYNIAGRVTAAPGEGVLTVEIRPGQSHNGELDFYNLETGTTAGSGTVFNNSGTVSIG